MKIRMMDLSFFDKMERKFGKYAIKNLPLIVTMCFGLSYLIYMFAPNVLLKIYFSPADIIVGHEYWRLFTWVLTPSGGVDILTILMLFVYYSFGVSIERGVGTFMYNVFVFGGWLLNTVCCLAVSIFEYFKINDDATFYLYSLTNNGFNMTYLMQISIFLGFALIYSNSVMMLYFILPLKAKWLAYFDIILLAYYFVSSDNIITRTSIIAYLLNFVFIYLGMRSRKRRKNKAASDIKRKRDRSRFNVIDGAAAGSTEGTAKKSIITRHKCAVCGRTELDDPELEFRFCSKCNGNYEYCSEHLYTHQHVR